jgi:hypothetical protein
MISLVFWNLMGNQEANRSARLVLLRPALMDVLVELRILDSDGQETLLSDRGRPRSSDTSDHLPLLFRLKV